MVNYRQVEVKNLLSENIDKVNFQELVSSKSEEHVYNEIGKLKNFTPPSEILPTESRLYFLKSKVKKRQYEFKVFVIFP